MHLNQLDEHDVTALRRVSQRQKIKHIAALDLLNLKLIEPSVSLKHGEADVQYDVLYYLTPLGTVVLKALEERDEQPEAATP